VIIDTHVVVITSTRIHEIKQCKKEQVVRKNSEKWKEMRTESE
jgi:hypothetical protein